MRALALALLLVATAACGAYRFPSGSATMGTVTGHVVAVPCSPVEYPDQPCKAAPVPGLEIDFISSHGDVVRAKTGEDGSYTVSLEAGTWTVTLKTIRVLKGPSTVNVKEGATTVADFVVDSGIRIPVPMP